MSGGGAGRRFCGLKGYLTIIILLFFVVRRQRPDLPAIQAVPSNKPEDILRKLLCRHLELNVGVLLHEAFHLVELDGAVWQHNFEVRLEISLVRQLQVVPFEGIAMYLTGKLQGAEVIGVPTLKVVHATLRGGSAASANRSRAESVQAAH